MELPLETWTELFRYLNGSDRANFIYCLLGEERPLNLPIGWQELLEFLDGEIKSEDSFVNQRKALRTAYTTYLKDKLGANIENYMNDDHLFCFQCHELLSISHVSLNENRAVVSRVKWDPEGLKIKSKKNFDYDNTFSEMRELLDKLLPPESDLGIVEGVKTVILTKECLKCHISAHFERSSYCDNCHKENMAVLVCGCGRGYCLLCTLPVLTEKHRLNGLCYRCNRFICDNCAECCHFVDINCYKRFCHRCAEECEFCGMETSCNEHADNQHYRLNLCLAPEPKNKFLYGVLTSTPTNDVQ